MESPGSAKMYASFASSSPSFMSPQQIKRQKERAALEQQAVEREQLVMRASTMTQIANLMAEQNEKMLEGLRAVASQREQDRPEKVDFVARNKAAVRPDRSGLGRKEYALIARAEVMAAASAHIDGGRAPPMPIHARKQTTVAPVDSSADLVRAAREEVERGLGITALEQQTRRPFRRR